MSSSLLSQFPFSSTFPFLVQHVFLLVQHGQHKLNFHNRRSTTLESHGAYCNVSHAFFEALFALEGISLLWCILTSSLTDRVTRSSEEVFVAAKSIIYKLI